MFCPRCGASNGDEVIFCRGCGLDLVEVRVAVGPGAVHSPAIRATFAERVADGQLRKQMRRAGVSNAIESPLTLEAKAIELRSRGIMGLLAGGGFAVLSYFVYLQPPVGGIFWMIPVIFAIVFLSAAMGRFVQSGSLRKLARRSDPDAFPEPEQRSLNPRPSRFETSDLEPPSSVTEATTRHLKVKTFTDGDE